MANYLIVCDGGARGNPGPSASAFVVFKDNKKIFSAGFYWGQKTNNQAEYLSLLMALNWLLEQNFELTDKIIVRMDSKLVVNQVLGSYKIKAQHLKPLVKQSQQLLSQLKKRLPTKLNHKLRSETHSADSLLNQILDYADKTAGR